MSRESIEVAFMSKSWKECLPEEDQLLLKLEEHEAKSKVQELREWLGELAEAVFQELTYGDKTDRIAHTQKIQQLERARRMRDQQRVQPHSV